MFVKIYKFHLKMNVFIKAKFIYVIGLRFCFIFSDAKVVLYKLILSCMTIVNGNVNKIHRFIIFVIKLMHFFLPYLIFLSELVVSSSYHVF